MLTREDFEAWLEDHKDEAFDRIEASAMTLPNWVRLFGQSLKHLQDTSDDQDDGDDEIGDFNFDEED
jgi:hypothetical protein